MELHRDGQGTARSALVFLAILNVCIVNFLTSFLIKVNCDALTFTVPGGRVHSGTVRRKCYVQKSMKNSYLLKAPGS